MHVLAIDPGTKKSAYVVWSGKTIYNMEIIGNTLIRDVLRLYCEKKNTCFAIEQIRHYGMLIGQTTLDTVFWSGIFWADWGGHSSYLIPRIEVKKHICKSGAAKDSNIRQALIDRFGSPGRKNNPGILYGVKKDLWQALALAVTVYDYLDDETKNIFDIAEYLW